MPRRHHGPGTLDLVLSALFVAFLAAVVMAIVAVVACLFFAIGKHWVSSTYTGVTMIALTPVTGSSQIAAHGYDPISHTLAVRFHKGSAVYHYKGVPQDEADKFARAPSLGQHLHAHIKNKFHFERQTEEA